MPVLLRLLLFLRPYKTKTLLVEVALVCAHVALLRCPGVRVGLFDDPKEYEVAGPLD